MASAGNLDFLIKLDIIKSRKNFMSLFREKIINGFAMARSEYNWASVHL